MRGWLIVNSFVESKKFHELYDFLKRSAVLHDIALDIKTTSDLLCEVESDFKDFTLPNFILFWDKDIYLARRLESMGVPLFNKSAAIEVCDNKILTALCLKGKVKAPRTIIAPKTFEGVNYSHKDFVKHAIEILGLPLIIKEAYGSFGKQVYLASTYEEAIQIVDKIGYKDFLMQEFIKTSNGRDIRVNVVGDKVVSAMLRYNDHDFRSNISNGGKSYQVDLSEEQKQIAIKACQTIGLDFAGVDLLFGENDEPLVCEVNSNPHFKSSLECTGIDMSLLIIEHIIKCLK